VALVRIDVSEERIASSIMVKRISELVLLRSVLQLLDPANIVLNSAILLILVMVSLRSSETSVLTRATRRHIPEDGNLHSHRRENLKSYIAITGWAL
jgi:hypothetical protein